jgi:cytochrome c oxidase subunit 3
MTPFWLPTINTALLLSSGVTLTIAHHALRAGRGATIASCGSPCCWASTFVFVQGYEYFHAYTELNLKLSSGAYGSTFFMLTGFHGFHVFIGMLMLLFITLRLMKGHFTADATSASRARPGTGTSWTWCGWASTRWSIGFERRTSRHSRKKAP